MNSAERDLGLEALLEYLRRIRGFDFTGYKRSSLERRIAKRIQTLNVEDFKDYIDYLEVHPEEFAQLFNAVLINVTNFFRDTETWDYLAQEIIPRILANKKAHDPIRIWSAGCASGEEAYTVAMLLAEAMGIDPFKQRAKIYATDADEGALAQARHGDYGSKDLELVPPALREKYLGQEGDRYVFRGDFRRSIIFGRHDLVQDAPISRLDLLICRNTLMYFNVEAQTRILSRFHFALNDKGFLFLGKAEMILTHANLFAPVDLKRRIFAKVPAVRHQETIVASNQPGDARVADQLSEHIRLRDLAFDLTGAAEIVVDRSGNLILANEEARTSFGLEVKDLGRPFQDLKLSYHPVELRSHIEQVYTSGQPITLTNVQRPLPGGKNQHLEVQLRLLRDSRQSLGVSISFQDVTRHNLLQEEIRHSKQALETAYEELQSTNEELETTNEELQSTVEELQTTNEELQSTNEEMETMNEELQATNEELQATNDEIRERTRDLNRLNTFLQSILTSVHVGIAVVDADFKILLWNERAEDLWGLRADEVKGRSLLKLDIGLPLENLQIPIQSSVSGKEAYREISVEAVNRRGKSIRCRITFTPSLGPDGEYQGVVLLMEEEEKKR
jgi:two-component system, chemotaxis family, CheB/CheR fusion protein